MRHTVGILMLCGALSLSFVSAPALAQTPSVSDLKKEAELQKKAAKAKEEWAKAEEKLKKLEKELRDAQEDAVKKREASEKAQRERDAFRLPTAK